MEAATTLVDTAVDRPHRARRSRSRRRRSADAARRRSRSWRPASSAATWAARCRPATGTFATGITSINGGRSDEFITTIDGAPSIRVRAAGGFMMGAQNFDTVAEVQVLTTNYQAEFGRASAGQLRLVTKSGTQSFRGNMFWSHQNDALDANTWTRRAGGPREVAAHLQRVRLHARRADLHSRARSTPARQKLFFFWGQEWQRDRTVEEQTGHRADRGDAERRLQRAACPARRDSRSADRPAVPGQHHPARPHQPAGPGAAQRAPAADSRIPAGREQLDRQPGGLQQPAEGQHQDRLGADARTIARGAAYLGAERLERSGAADACTRRSGITRGARWPRR